MADTRPPHQRIDISGRWHPANTFEELLMVLRASVQADVGLVGNGVRLSGPASVVKHRRHCCSHSAFGSLSVFLKA